MCLFYRYSDVLPGTYVLVEHDGQIVETDGELLEEEANLFIRRESDGETIALIPGETLLDEVAFLIRDNEGLEDYMYDRRSF